jgi:hypothetical protein
MNDRARAIAILQQARDILAERLTEQVLEGRDSILEDAIGLSYSSEIDAIQEQIGQRLNNVNMLLNNLPPIEDAPAPTADDVAPAPPPALSYQPQSSLALASVDSASVDAQSAENGSLESVQAEATDPDESELILSAVAVDALMDDEAEDDRAMPISFQSFAERIMANDVEGAGIVLAGLFDVSVDRGRQCARRFQEQLSERPQFLQKAMGLRHELTSGSVNGSLILLWECFGLQGIESLSALQSLKARMNAGSSA